MVTSASRTMRGAPRWSRPTSTDRSPLVRSRRSSQCTPRTALPLTRYEREPRANITPTGAEATSRMTFKSFAMRTPISRTPSSVPWTKCPTSSRKRSLVRRWSNPWGAGPLPTHRSRFNPRLVLCRGERLPAEVRNVLSRRRICHRLVLTGLASHMGSGSDRLRVKIHKAPQTHASQSGRHQL